MNFFKMFDTMVMPILTHGSEIGGYEYTKCIEKIQSKACKGLLGLISTINDSMVLGECGRLPVAIKYNIKYWLSLL